VRTTERSVSTPPHNPTRCRRLGERSGASGHAIPIAPATADGAPSGGIVRGSVAERESAARMARGAREGKPLHGRPQGQGGPGEAEREATGSAVLRRRRDKRARETCREKHRGCSRSGRTRTIFDEEISHEREAELGDDRKPIYWMGGAKGGVGKSMLTMAAIDYLRSRGDKCCSSSAHGQPDVWKAYTRRWTGRSSSTCARRMAGSIS